ncbi:DNA internalization-related competence protein ComEC/Rec2 [Shewanella sp. 125m-3]
MLWPSLVNLYILPLLIVVVITACKRAPFIAGSLLAISWISIFYSLLMDWNTGENIETLNVEAEIISLVHTNGDRISMDIVLIDSISPHLVSRRMRLIWNEAPFIVPGQRWQLQIKVKPITSILNQGGFNQQKHLLAKHIIGKGKVISGQILTTDLSYRMRLIEKLKLVLSPYESADLLLALLSGDKSMISSERWQQLRNTGAGHLFAISGLHLSVVSLWLLIAAKLVLYRRFPVSSRRNWLCCLAFSLLGVVAYAYLAGFSVSTQRALIMLIAYISFSVLSRHSSSWERLLYALFVILLIDPLSPLSASFWLSFCALTIILLTVTRYFSVAAEATSGSLMSVTNRLETHSAQICTSAPHSLETNAPEINSPAAPTRCITAAENKSSIPYRHLWPQLKIAALAFWAVQWRLTLGLGVIQAIFFSGTSLVSLLVNLVLVPWFSLVLIPISLMSLLAFIIMTALGFSGGGVFTLAALAMTPVVNLLDYASEVNFVWLDLSDEVVAALIMASIGLYLLVNIKQLTWRLPLSVMLLPLVLSVLFHFSGAPKENRWQVHLLDVGQGLSLVIEKNNRALIYDTGARYGDTFSYADRVLLPFLKSQGIGNIDYLVVSHGDNDHAGGAAYIIDKYPDVAVISDLIPIQQHSCRPKTLVWQNLNLEILAPLEPKKGNNGSCVIRVSDTGNSVLLTGDIEKQTEYRLLERAAKYGFRLQSRLLIAPHHGSRTSSTTSFIDAVAPELVLFPAGFRNRYGFPKKEVVERYEQRDIAMFTAGEQGQVSVLFDQETMKVRTYRSDFAPFWYSKVFRFGQNKNPE